MKTKSFAKFFVETALATALMLAGASATSAWANGLTVYHIRPAAVIATHVNEGATSDGKLKPNSRTGSFIKLSKPPVHLAISGRTMEFDGKAKCVTGAISYTKPITPPFVSVVLPIIFLNGFLVRRLSLV